MRRLLAVIVAIMALYGFSEDRVGQYYGGSGNLLVENAGEFSQTEPFLIPLTDDSDENCALLCSVVYEDMRNQLPSTREELEAMKRTGELVNDFLSTFLKELFDKSGERAFFLEEYKSENVAEDILEYFAEYADQKMRSWNKNNPDKAIDVEIKAVSMRANRMMLEEMEK